jgi:hypothetical protein
MIVTLMTLSIITQRGITKHNDTVCSSDCGYTECRYAECSGSGYKTLLLAVALRLISAGKSTLG